MLSTFQQVEDQSFDYVVIGGGLSGLVLATRLSEDPSISVLVLEAGEPNIGDPMILSPLQVTSHLGNSQYDWNYETTPQAGLDGLAIPWPRGKGLGGSSAINFFAFHLPARSDIDAFEELGNKGWNWDALKPYYQKVENFVSPRTKVEAMRFDLAEHGRRGPITVAFPKEMSGLETPFQDALESFGIPRTKEPFSGDTKGSWLTPYSVDPDTATRSYAVNGYYEPNATRSNLSVLTGAHVIGIETSKTDDGLLKATSVRFSHNGKVAEAKANKEVILAAGAIGTPQILELSGIGDPEVLSKAGVALKHALPGVGNNVQEHLQIWTTFEMLPDPENKYQTIDGLRDPAELARQLDIYMKSGSGPLAMGSCCMSFSPMSAISLEYEKLQKDLTASLERGASESKYSKAIQKQHAIQLDHIKRNEPSCEHVLFAGAPPVLPIVQAKIGTKYGSIVGLINHPFTRGTLHISSAESSSAPRIDPKYFDEIYDLKTMVEAIKFARRLVRAEPMKSIFSGVEICPGPEYESDEKVVEYIKKFVKTSYHTVGTCSMLPVEDDGVVDTNLKVYGAQNIRIVDISVIPLHVGAHLQATAYAIAELAADIIKGKVSM